MDTVEVKLKDRARALAGAFVGMLSPVLLAIVLKKTNLKQGVHKYEFIRMFEAFFGFFEGTFLHLAALTLEVGMGPFLCVMISEAFASWLPHLNYISQRFHAASKFLVLVSNILLILLGCVVLFFIHNNAWFSWLVVSACFIVAAVAMYSCCWWWRRYIRGSPGADNNVGGLQHPEGDYHHKLEHSLEFSACIAGMMFLVLGSVVLEGLLRNTQLSQPAAAAAPTPPSEGPTTKAPAAGTLLAATLFVSFFTSAFAAFLLNVWTIPLVVVTGAWVWGFNIALAILAVVVVILIAWEGLQLKALLGTLLPPCVLLLVLLKRCSCGYGNNEGGGGEEEETKPAPLELTKVTFTCLLAVAVAVPGVTTTASPGFWKKVFVFCAAATVPLGLLWRLLTHKNAPSPAVLRAVNDSSFLAQAFLFFAGIAFWGMAVSAPN